MKTLMMNTCKAKKSFRLLIFSSSIGALMLASGCTHTRDINVSYSPLPQTLQLANRNEIQKVVVGNFIDARPNDELSRIGGGINIHSYTWKTQKNIPDLVRGAFEDALLKTGFVVNKPNEIKQEPLFTLTGKVLAYNFSYSGGARHLTLQTRYGASTASVEAHVEVELLLQPKFGDPVTIIVKGEDFQNCVSYEPSYIHYEKDYTTGIEKSIIHPDVAPLTNQVRTDYTIKALDGAMHNCVMNLLHNKEFLKLISK